MRPASRVQSVIELLEHIIDVQKPADNLVQSYFRTRRFIGSKDRTCISDDVYGILRHWYRLNWFLDTIDARKLVIANFVLNKKFPAQVVSEFFSGDKYAPYPLSDEEKKFLNSLEEKSLDEQEIPDDARLECPSWAAPYLRNALKECFESEMQALQMKAPLTLRVNKLKATRESVLNTLKENGIEAVAGDIVSTSVHIHERLSIVNNVLFQQGRVEIQDEGSQAIAALAAVKPGEQVLDFCAGAGGKTLALAAEMENTGKIVATDISAQKLKSAKIRLRRAGVHNAETRVLSKDRDQWLRRQKNRFDLVLVDAPCSGTGTWRRSPELRWKRLGPGLNELVALQSQILDQAASCVKPGGRLVYATCSLLNEENEDQVAAFCRRQNEFQMDSLSVPGLPLRQGFLRLFPGQHGTDGFFAACLTRQKN